MRFSQLKRVLLLFELFKSFTVILLLYISVDISIAIHLHYLSAKELYLTYSVIITAQQQFYGCIISM